MNIQLSGKGLFIPEVIQGVIRQIIRKKSSLSQVKQKTMRDYFFGLAIAGLSLFSSGASAELILNGSTIYTDLGRDQFVAALYTEIRHNNPQAIETMESDKRMEVRILNDYSKRRWVNLWMQSISINNNREAFSAAAEELIALMQAPKSAPRKGDLLEYIFSPQEGTSMRFNGTELISSLSGDVFELMLRTWIGAIPPSTNFKEELLGNQRNIRSRDLLETLAPAEDRIALAASWIAPAPSRVATPTPAPSEPAAEVAEEKVSDKKGAALAEKPEPEAKPVGNSETSQQLAKNPEASHKQQLVDAADSIASDSTAENEEAEEEVDFDVAQALAQRDYTPLVVQRIYKNISYPSRAVSKNQEGTVRVALQIGRSGELQTVLTTQQSQYSSLNRAALKAVQKAAPFPELPEAITADSFELSIPITFRLQ